MHTIDVTTKKVTPFESNLVNTKLKPLNQNSIQDKGNIIVPRERMIKDGRFDRKIGRYKGYWT